VLPHRPPPSWLPSDDTDRGGALDAATVVGPAANSPAGVGTFPPPNWPSKAQLDYAQAMIVLGLLILALPWVVGKLVTNPGAVFAGVIARKVP
jgi:hypothetical protein